jgi:hypothetical protein
MKKELFLFFKKTAEPSVIAEPTSAFAHSMREQLSPGFPDPRAKAWPTH